MAQRSRKLAGANGGLPKNYPFPGGKRRTQDTPVHDARQTCVLSRQAAAEVPSRSRIRHRLQTAARLPWAFLARLSSDIRRAMPLAGWGGLP